MFNRKLSSEEAINEQNGLLGLINQSEISVTKGKTGRPFSEGNKNIIKIVVKNLKQAYETRNLIIHEFENSEGEQKGKTKEVDLNWLKYPEYFITLLKNIKPDDYGLSIAFGRKKIKK